MRLQKIIFALLLGVFLSSAQAQELHSKAYLIQDGNTFASGMRLGIHLDIDKGWHTYWQNPGDVGAPPELNITSSIPISQSDLIYSLPSRITSDPFDFYGYENEMLVYKTLSLEHPVSDSFITLHVRFDWLICQVLCVPCSRTFDLKLPIDSQVGKPDGHFDSFSFPQNNPDIASEVEFKSDQTILTFLSKSLLIPPSIDFFPTSEINQVFNKPGEKEISNHKARFTYAATKSRDMRVRGLLKFDAKTAYWIGGDHISTAAAPTLAKKKPHILFVLFLAFLGGILLNFMPCVLPVVSLKILSTLQSADTQKNRIRKTNLIYAAGICASVFALALIFIGLRGTGQNLGWGFQLQSPAFVTFLVFFFFLIGLNLIGVFEIPSIYIPGVGRAFQKKSWFADFIGGFLMTLVATPCTAPFMAVAIGYALVQKPAIVIATFFSLGLGLSLPYLLLAWFPKVARIFPKPGPWMVKLKEFLSFPMFLTVAWLVWVLNQLTQSKAVLFVLSALVLVVFFFWSRQKLFSRISSGKKLFLIGVVFATFSLAYIPLRLNQPDGIQWEPFDPSKISSFANSITFVDFTADWCITCKANERITLSSDEVQKFFMENHVRTVKADWTRRNPQITAILQQYDRAGVPLYLLYKPELTTPIVLPTLLTPAIVIDAIASKGENK